MAMALHNLFLYASPPSSTPLTSSQHPCRIADGSSSSSPSFCFFKLSPCNRSLSSSGIRLTPSLSLCSASFSLSASFSSSLANDLTGLPKTSENGGNGSFGDGNGNKEGNGGGNGDGNGGGGGRGEEDEGNESGVSVGEAGIFSAFLRGWNDRVGADPQFPFKVVTEEIIGVGACVIGDMASRPNFGLNELDFVFSTIVVGSILNFSLMYMLAPTSLSHLSSSRLPFFFSQCPVGYMFEPGSYTLAQRLGTFVYKGTVFATVGFFAGLLGTSLSNGLIAMRKKMDPSFKTDNKSPPTILNAATWAIHMGISSNLRYQAINGMEFGMAKALSPSVFKILVFIIRGLNNVSGGMSFVALARLTGSQRSEENTLKKYVRKAQDNSLGGKGTAISSIELQALPVDTSSESSLTQQNQKQDKVSGAVAVEEFKED